MDSGASYVNAGYITPSHFIPLAAPGIITKGIKWMFDSSSPFYVKPRVDLDFLKWSLAFKKSATKTKVEKAIQPILDINLLGRDLYEDLKKLNDFNFHYDHKGLLMLYKSDNVGEEEWEFGKKGIQQGLQVENLSANEVEKLQPNTNLNIKGAVYYHSDAHMTPGVFMKEMISCLDKKGVVFYKNETVKDLNISRGKITSIITDKREIEVDEVVLAAGSWSPQITKKLGLKIPIQAGKGYSINVKNDTKITIPAILCEAKVAITPMQGFTRFAGTMEIAGINHTINAKRVDAIANAVKNYYENILNGGKFKFLDRTKEFQIYDYFNEYKYYVVIDCSTGYEALARGKKVAHLNIVYDVSRVSGGKNNRYGWPGQFDLKGPFWTNKASKEEIFRCLDFIFSEPK